MKPAKVRLREGRDQIEAQDTSWINLGELRELVRQADAHGWVDSCLVSHGAGVGDHPSVRGLRCATRLVVEGPS